jgi:hypothetical protein
MTTFSPATDAATTTIHRSRARRVTAAAALVSGLAFLTDTVTITVINRSFGTPDDALFLSGLAALAVALIALSIDLSARTAGIRRAGLAIVVFVAVFSVIGGLAKLMDTLGRHIFSTDNVGLHGEWSFFTVGLVMVAIALRVGSRLRTPAAE